jgi:hypothetical protein
MLLLLFFFFFVFLSSLLSLVAQRVWVSGEDVEESEKMSLGKERV